MQALLVLGGMQLVPELRKGRTCPKLVRAHEVAVRRKSMQGRGQLHAAIRRGVLGAAPRSRGCGLAHGI